MTSEKAPETELTKLLRKAARRDMTPEEINEQRASWVRGMEPTGDPRFD